MIGNENSAKKSILRYSVLTSVRNEEKYIEDSVKSVLENTEHSDSAEMIVVDDNSSDRTWDVLQELSQNYGNLIIAKNDKRGKVSAYNKAYELASSHCFMFFAGDDMLESNAVADRLNDIEKESRPAISFCRIRMFSDDTKFNGIEIPKNKKKGAKTGGAMAFNKYFGDMLFPIPDSLPNEDTWTLCLSKLKTVKTIDVPVIGIHYRIHKGNTISRSLPFSAYSKLVSEREKAFCLFLKKYLHQMIDPEIKWFNAKIELESDRVNRRYLSLFLKRNISFREKIRAFICSNSLFYGMMQLGYRFFVGWS